MKLYFLIISLYGGYVLANSVSNVRLIDHINYIIDVIGETVKKVESKEWCNLKVPDASVVVDDVVLGRPINGTIHYKNGFVVSIQAINIDLLTVRGQITLNTERLAQGVITGTLSMHDVAIGYDVKADLDNGNRWYTAVYVYNTVNVIFTVTKIIDSGAISVTVTNTISTNENRPRFMPTDNATDILTTLFDPNMSANGIKSWGPENFQPLAHEVVNQHVSFPEICYNCPG